MKKDEIKILCSGLYGIHPKAVVYTQKTIPFSIATAFTVSDFVELANPFFIESIHFAHSKKVAGLENYIAIGVTKETSKTVQISYDVMLSMMCKYLRVTSSANGDVDLTITGYECIL